LTCGREGTIRFFSLNCLFSFLDLGGQSPQEQSKYAKTG
jgi:hypothetical protein